MPVLKGSHSASEDQRHPKDPRAKTLTISGLTAKGVSLAPTPVESSIRRKLRKTWVYRVMGLSSRLVPFRSHPSTNGGYVYTFSRTGSFV